ncbi:MAG: glycosyltransferase family 2 protein [Pyrinomonadaceae bacterium]
MSQSICGISIFFPAFNDERTIGGLVSQALNLLPTFTDDYEVLVVNDGSTDSTQEVLEELAGRSEHLKLVRHERNLGYGVALRSGFNHATKELIFYTDGDGQYDVREMVNMLPLMTKDCDVVNGYKISRSDPAHRKIAGAIYNRFARLFFRLPIRDVDCDFRLIKRSAMRCIELTSSDGAVCVELIYKLRRSGSAFAEMPVHHYPRAHGRSQFFTPLRLARTVRDFSVLWLRLVALQRTR